MFREILQGIVEGADGVGAVLMGYDGIAVEQFFRGGQQADLQMMAVEYAAILKEIRKAAEILETGSMEEVAIRTERYHVLLRSLTDEYFVALTLEPPANIGKGRFLLLRDSFLLRQEVGR